LSNKINVLPKRIVNIKANHFYNKLKTVFYGNSKR